MEKTFVEEFRNDLSWSMPLEGRDFRWVFCFGNGYGAVIDQIIDSDGVFACWAVTEHLAHKLEDYDVENALGGGYYESISEIKECLRAIKGQPDWRN